VSFRTPNGGWGGWRPWWRFHHYYYHSWPTVFVWGGWGTGWYDPWWWGPYWWPHEEVRVIIVHEDDDDGIPSYDYDRSDRPRDTTSDWEHAEWMVPELRTALDDFAGAWTSGDVQKLQAHLTPTLAIAVRHDWEQQEEPWLLAPPVLLDIVLQALDAQRDSIFRFVQAEQMEPGLVWAVGEHSFTADQGGRIEATMEVMFRRYENTWLVEAITASSDQYRWLADDLLKDAATESARLLDQMKQAQAAEPKGD